MGKLGRTTSGLQSNGLVGFDSDIRLGAKLAAGLHASEYPERDDMNEQLALGERFSRLDSSDDNGLLTVVVREVAGVVKLRQGSKSERSGL